MQWRDRRWPRGVGFLCCGIFWQEVAEEKIKIELSQRAKVEERWKCKEIEEGETQQTETRAPPGRNCAFRARVKLEKNS